MSGSGVALPGVVLVGGGPGDPGLMTVAGREATEQADVILVDHLAPTGALAWAPAGAVVIDVAKLPRGEATPQERINQLLIEHASVGRRAISLPGIPTRPSTTQHWPLPVQRWWSSWVS